MASDCAALGSFSRMIVEGGSTPRTFDANSERYGFIYETIQSRRILQGRRRIVGTRNLYSQSLRPHSYIISGAIGLQVAPKDLTEWIPRIFGGSFSGGTLTLSDDLPAFDILLDRENDIFRYSNCRVATAMITGSQHLGSEEEEFIELVLTIVAETEANGQTWPSPAPAVSDDPEDAPYIHSEASISISSTVRQQDSFSLSIDNDIYMAARGSLTPNCIRAGDRRIRLAMRGPFTSTTSALALSTWAAGVAGSLTLARGNMSTVFSFPHLRNVYNSPNVRSKNEVPQEWQFEAARTEDDPVVAITHDATP